jgi:hypothetical protein
MLKLVPLDPQWIDLVLPQGPVRVQMRPINRAAARTARDLVGRAMLGTENPDLGAVGDVMSAELIRAGLVAWEGIGDATGNPVPVTPENIELLLQHDDAFRAIETAYCNPWYDRDREKNGLPGSPNGIGTAAMPGNDIATSPARPKPKAAARNAPIAKTRRKARPAKPSGK